MPRSNSQPGKPCSSDPLKVLLMTVCAILLFQALATLTCLAQESSPATAQRPRQVHPITEQKEPDEVLRIDTDLVSVDVNATDVDGRTVRTLQQKDFKLYEDGIEQPLAF